MRHVFWTNLVLAMLFDIAVTLVTWALGPLLQQPTQVAGVDLYNLIVRLVIFVIDPVAFFGVFYWLGSSFGPGPEGYLSLAEYGFVGAFFGGAAGFALTTGIDAVLYNGAFSANFASPYFLANLVISLASGATSLAFLSFTGVILGQHRSRHSDEHDTKQS